MRIQAHQVHLQPHLAGFGLHGQFMVPVDVHPGVLKVYGRRNGLRGFGQATESVNVGPGVIVQMTPADAASYWATGAVTSASGGDASSGVDSSSPTYGGAFGTYTDTVQSAYAASPTLAYDMQSAADVTNPSAPEYMPGTPSYQTETSALGPATTSVMTLDSFLAQLTSEMTGSGIDSSVTAGGASNIAAQAAAYSAATGIPNDAATVAKYQAIFNTWAQGSENLTANINPGGTISDTWGSSGLPLNTSSNPSGSYVNESPGGGSTGAPPIASGSGGTSTVHPTVSSVPSLITSPAAQGSAVTGANLPVVAGSGTPAVVSGCPTGETCTFFSTIPDTYVYIGGAAIALLVLMMVMKK